MTSRIFFASHLRDEICVSPPQRPGHSQLPWSWSLRPSPYEALMRRSLPRTRFSLGRSLLPASSSYWATAESRRRGSTEDPSAGADARAGLRECLAWQRPAFPHAALVRMECLPRPRRAALADERLFLSASCLLAAFALVLHEVLKVKRLQRLERHDTLSALGLGFPQLPH
jgi:hypothetical protein